MAFHSGGRVRYSGRRRPSTGDSHCSHTACKGTMTQWRAMVRLSVGLDGQHCRNSRTPRPPPSASTSASARACPPHAPPLTLRFRAAFTSRLMTLLQVTHCFSRCWGPSTRKLWQALHRWDVQNSSCREGRVGGGESGRTGRGSVAPTHVGGYTVDAASGTPARCHPEHPRLCTAAHGSDPNTVDALWGQGESPPPPAHPHPQAEQGHKHNTNQVYNPSALLEVVQDGLQGGRRGQDRALGYLRREGGGGVRSVCVYAAANSVGHAAGTAEWAVRRPLHHTAVAQPGERGVHPSSPSSCWSCPGSCAPRR